MTFGGLGFRVSGVQNGWLSGVVVAWGYWCFRVVGGAWLQVSNIGNHPTPENLSVGLNKGPVSN